MSQEIVYTSAPKGLKAGSRGFCTVASTSGMAVNLAERLESLSGYRHAYLPHEEKASLNPVNYSHQTVTVGGRKYHVLSRICNAGLDYTQRSNKLAHHVALDQREVMAAPGGPAWVLQDKDFCVTEWSGDPRHLPAGRTPRPEDCPQGRCATWEKVTGDAGWAGVLAESLDKNAGRPMSIIFKPGIDTLQLLIEAISLLPVEKRWNVTFSTYCTNAASDAKWRFLLEGTDEATKIQRNPHAPKIDLTQNLGRAEGGELVNLARSGAARPGLARPSAGNKIARRVAPGSKPQAPGFADASELTEMPAPPPEGGRPPAPGAKQGMAAPPVQDPLGIGLSKPKKKPASLVLYGVVALVIVGLLMGAFMLGQGSNENDRTDEIVQKALADKKKQEKEEAERAAERARSNDRKDPKSEDNDNENQNGNPNHDPMPRSNDNGNDHRSNPPEYKPPTLAEPQDQTVDAGQSLSLDIVGKPGVGNGNLRYSLLPPVPDGATIDAKTGKFTWKPNSSQYAQDHQITVQVEDESRPGKLDEKTFTVTVAVSDPFVDIRSRNRTLQLPTPNRSGVGVNEPHELAKLYVKPSDLRLDLLAMELSKQDGFEVEFKRDEGNAPMWTLWQTREKTNTSGAAAVVSGNKPKAVATFELSGQALTFQWHKERPSVTLGACLLHIMAGRNAETCVLTKPRQAEPVRVDFVADEETGTTKIVELEIEEEDLPGRDSSGNDILRLDLQLDNFPKYSLEGGELTGLKTGEPLLIKFGNEKRKEPIAALRAQLRWRESDPKPSLVIEPFAFPKVLSPDGTIAGILPRPLTGDPKLARRNQEHGWVNPSYLEEECSELLADVTKRGDAYREAIAVLEKKLRNVDEELAKIGNAGKRFNELVKQLDAAIAKNKKKEIEDLTKKVGAAELEWEGKKRRLPAITSERNRLAKELTTKRTFLNKGKIAAENLEYAKLLAPIMDAIKSNGVIQFRAYFDVKGGEVERQVLVVESGKPNGKG